MLWKIKQNFKALSQHKPENFAVVKPAVSFPATSLPPNETRLIEKRSEEDRTRNEREQAHEHQPEAHCNRFVSFFNAPHRHQEVAGPSSCTREFDEAHDGQEHVKLCLTVDRTCTISGRSTCHVALKWNLAKNFVINQQNSLSKSRMHRRASSLTIESMTEERMLRCLRLYWKCRNNLRISGTISRENVNRLFGSLLRPQPTLSSSDFHRVITFSKSATIDWLGRGFATSTVSASLPH